jgi:hypothetical protein
MLTMSIVFATMEKTRVAENCFSQLPGGTREALETIVGDHRMIMGPVFSPRFVLTSPKEHTI